MMTKYYGDDKGRYVSIDDLTEDIYIGRLRSKSFGDFNFDNILNLVKSIITSKNSEHYYYDEYSSVILGRLHISITTERIHINGNVGIKLICSISNRDITMRFFNEFLNYFNNW